MPDYHGAPGIALPRALHTLTPAAEHARQAVRDYAARRNAEREAPPELVTVHPKPWLAVDLEVLHGSALGYAKAARAVGHNVVVFKAGEAVEVRVRKSRGDIIRAWWVAGRTTGCLVNGLKASVTEAKAAL